ncbi:MAG: hypothetical protein MMC33_002425 [Icmadophila ericetorum]|nr:hypothetical protein [Icmadophila ericetorum]
MAAKTPPVFCCCQLSLRRSPSFLQLLQSRQFSQSSSRRKHETTTGPLPTFPQTSNPDLDALLTTFRNNVFLPAHLTKPQRKLIYKKNLQGNLTGEEPVYVSLGGSDEKHTLRPINRLQDEPHTVRSFHTILDLLKDGSNWNVIPPLLESLKQSKRELPDGAKAKLIRRAGEAGQTGIVMECLQRVNSTDLRLDNIEVAHEAMLLAVGIAIRSSWSQEGLRKAIRFSENILDFMLQDQKQAFMPGKPSKIPLFRAEITGVPMALAVTRSVLFPDLEANTRSQSDIPQYIQQTLNLFRNTMIFNLAEPHKLESLRNWRIANEYLIKWTPVWLGLKMATKILDGDPSLLRRVKVRLVRQLDPVIEVCRKNIIDSGNMENDDSVKRRGLVMYEEISAVLQ